MDRFDNYDEGARGIIKNTYRFASECGHNPVNVDHLFYVMTNQSNNEITNLLTKVGADVNSIKHQTQEELHGLLSLEGNLGISSELNQVYIDAEKIIKVMGDSKIGIYHIFLSLLKSKNPISKILNSQGITFDKMKSIIEIMPKAKLNSDQQFDTPENPASESEILNKYSEDLIQLAKEKKLKEVIGREKDLEKMIEILCRKEKNNLVILGDAGVGKTALAELLAQKIASGEVPSYLQDKIILRVNLGSIISGTKFRGEFEEKISGIIKQVKESHGKIILFIDEFHNVAGAGKAEGSMDLAEMLKPELSSGNIQVIGATTTSQYRQSVEKDTGLTRRFETIIVQEPSVQDTITILRGIEGSFEKHHGVTIYDTALIAAVELSNRYITDRKLPDKAISVLDQAATKVKISMTLLPQSISEMNIKIGELQKEKLSIGEEIGGTTNTITKQELQQRLDKISSEISKLEISYKDKKSARENIKRLFDENKGLEKQLQDLEIQAKTFEEKSDLEKLAEIRNGKIIEIQNQIKINKEEISKLQTQSGIQIKDTVQREDIAKVISEKTGIPLTQMEQNESEKLAHLEEYLSTKVIGQSEAISAISNAIRRARIGLKDPKKPIGSFIFLGPTGVGKTELAKALAEFLFSDKKAMVRFNMSEFQEEHSASKLIGSPPGYVGYESGGQLTEAIRTKPYSVILLDEVEKAHQKVFDLFLQVFDDGMLNDSLGNTVDFKNTIIIMTSNIGSHEIMDKLQGSESIIGDLYPIQSEADINPENSEEHKRNRKHQKKKNNTDGKNTLSQTEDIKEELKPIMMEFFRPELLNRLDDTIIFNPISPDMFKAILEIKLKQQSDLIYSNSKITINLSNKAKNYIAKKGRDPANGARPIDRAIQNYLTNPIAKEIVGGTFNQGDSINVDCENDKLIFQKNIQ